MQWASAPSGPGKACLEDIYNDSGNLGRSLGKRERMTGVWRGGGDSGKEATLGTHLSPQLSPDTHLGGLHTEPCGSPQGATAMSSGRSQAASTEAAGQAARHDRFLFRGIESSEEGGPGTSFQPGREIPPHQLPHFPPIKSMEFPFIKLFPKLPMLQEKTQKLLAAASGPRAEFLCGPLGRGICTSLCGVFVTAPS